MQVKNSNRAAEWAKLLLHTYNEETVYPFSPFLALVFVSKYLAMQVFSLGGCKARQGPYYQELQIPLQSFDFSFLIIM